MNQPLKLHAHVVLADDDADDGYLLSEAFKEAGWAQRVTLHLLKNGEQLMQFLNERAATPTAAEGGLPDLLLLDLNMPRKDGRQALAEIKQDPRLCRLPVIIYTTSSDPDDIQNCYTMGASSFITKPVDFEELMDMVQCLSHYWLDIVHLP